MSAIHLRMCGYVATIALHITNGLYMTSFHQGEVMEVPEIREYIGVKNRFITCWTFLFQIVYAFIGLLCDILTLLNLSNKRFKLFHVLSESRDTMFTAIIWPSTMEVAALFWPMYLWDIGLVYPDFIWRVISPLSNYVIHVAIVPIVVWELVLRPQKEPESHEKPITVLTVYSMLYWFVLFYTHYEQGIWIYPIFKRIEGTIYVPLLIYYTCILLAVIYKMQWVIIRRLHPDKVAKVNKKEVAALFWPMYLWDIGLVYPDFIWRVISPLSNYVIHVAIVPIVVWELVLRPQKEPESHEKPITVLTVYSMLYWFVLFYTHYEQGIWIYPIFKRIEGTIYVPLLIYYTCILLAVIYKMQWVIIRRLHPDKVAKVNKKEVAALFWPMYLWDIGLVYPDFIWRVISPLSNYVIHVAIVPIVVWELVLRPQKEPESHEKPITVLTVYSMLYWFVLFYTHYEQGIWIYPIFKRIEGTIYVPLLIYYTCILLAVIYKMQWVIIRRLHPDKVAKVNKKVK